MRPRGMRAIRTPQSLARRSRGASREQAVAELARLEHEKARLLREREVWQQNLARTDQQIERAEARLAELRQLIDGEAPAPGPARPARAEPPPASDAYAMITLEY